MAFSSKKTTFLKWLKSCRIAIKLVSVIELPKRIFGPMKRKKFTNIENLVEFNFTLERVHRNKGITALLRLKNEEDKITVCLKSIYLAFDEIICIDNGSTDNTLKQINDFINDNNATHIKVYGYPFKVSRVGSEHNETDENSVHNLAYFYNYSLSKCTKSYVCKWDGDMVLEQQSLPKLKSIFAKLNAYWPQIIAPEIMALYQKKQRFYLAINEINCEERIFPNRNDYCFIKADNFERLSYKNYLQYRLNVKDVLIYEWKDTDQDEFSHWSNLDFVTKRKKVEYENFNLIKSTPDEKIDTNQFKEIEKPFKKWPD